MKKNFTRSIALLLYTVLGTPHAFTPNPYNGAFSFSGTLTSSNEAFIEIYR